MYNRFHRSAFAILACCLVSLLAACDLPPFDTTGQAAGPNPQVSTPQSTVAPSTAPPQTQTGCPTPGTNRAAVMAPIAAGADQNIVYVFNLGQNAPVSGILRRYDVVTGAKTDIVSIPQVALGAAQLSTDGQWVIFVSQVAGHAAIQLVRLDGQSLQTLYCDDQTGILQLQMSPDQQTVVFTRSGAASGVYMFHLAVDGKITMVAGGTFSLVTWLDNTRLYALSTTPQATIPPKLALLDTNKPGQSANALPLIFTPASVCASFDSSLDATKLYYSQCRALAATGQGPSSIAALPAAGGGTPNTIYNSATQAVTTVRVASASMLLFLVKNPPPARPAPPGTPPTSGLWRINVDGTGLTHLVNVGTGQDAMLNEYSQYTWSNVSRDGKLFAIKTIDQNGGQTLSFGAIAGGNATPFAQVAGVGVVHMVGWTGL